MPNDPFYRSDLWKTLRRARLNLDRHTCVVPGCDMPASIVDHIVPRYRGGPDTLSNLRSLCRRHDLQIKERPGRLERGNQGQLRPGCDVDGRPRDPAHPWFRAHKRGTGHEA
jgi:hypothetical protein